MNKKIMNKTIDVIASLEEYKELFRNFFGVPTPFPTKVTRS